VLNTWIGGTLVAVAVIFWLASLMSYDPSGLRVDWSAHLLIPYMPRFGIALGLFALCQLIGWGLVGAISPLLRPETAISSGVIVAPCCSASSMPPVGSSCPDATCRKAATESGKTITENEMTRDAPLWG
jgi:hypothetical protein